MANEIVVKYGDTDITYNETRNRWEYVKNGRNSSADSLEAAKKNIDTESKAGRKNAFSRTEAFKFSSWGSETAVDCVATSVAEYSYRSVPELWVSYPEGSRSRSKESANYIYPKTPGNLLLLERYKALQEQKKTVEDNLRRLRDQMTDMVEIAKQVQKL